MSSAPSSPPVVKRKTSLATRTMVGVVSLVAVVLVALAATTYVIAGRVVDSELEDNLEQVWQRTNGFLVEEKPETNAPPVDPDDFDDLFDDDDVITPTPTGPVDPMDRDPLETPGLPIGTIVYLVGEDSVQSGIVNSEGTTEELDDDDAETIKAAVSGGNSRTDRSGHTFTRLDLAGAEYLVQFNTLNAPGETKVSGSDSTTLVTAIPATDANQTKANLLVIEATGAAIALVIVGFGVWWWVRRSMLPLGNVSGVAARVSRVPMESGAVDLTRYRVPNDLAQPTDEVGDVGFALNQLIDSVDSALAERTASENQLRQFVADASHELRTPLAAVRGYSEMMVLTEPLTENGRTLLGRVQAQSERMSELVEQLLFLARMDAAEAQAHSQLQTEPAQVSQVDLGELLMDAVSDAHAAGRDHHWEVQVPDEPVSITSENPEQLSRLMTNLLSNARKHTPEGTNVSTKLLSEEGQAVLTIADDGPGIAPELVTKVFDRFVRGSDARAPSEGSTGLGLSIARSVAEAHGGSITVDSAPGSTVFTVKLPLA
ncbi:sensor histidine kinase [Ancrocorticia populi]|uniref:sensor histidine kinase n=2 Tax=Ancrocorticia populi TaxID=2175228 RepID=UPI0023551DA1|nr:HAMP domain-containing sensor histidine kinase [Ancrocorticia populi]